MTREPAEGLIVAGEYRLDAVVRSGQLGGSVWRGSATDSHRRVTVVFPCNDDDERRNARRFLVIAAIQHPHLAAPIDHGFDERPYLVYEGLDGETLKAATPLGRFTVHEALRLADQLLRAVESAHDRGLVHGALDGDCVFLVPRAQGGVSPKILGFGLDAGAGDDPADDVAAVANALIAVFEQIIHTDTADAPVPTGLLELLARARHKDRSLVEAADLRAAIDDVVQRHRRPRTADARVVMATAPSMKRAMHDVMLQTSEQAAIPLGETDTLGERPATKRRGRQLAPEPLVPVLPRVQVQVADAEAAPTETQPTEAQPSGNAPRPDAAAAPAPPPPPSLEPRLGDAPDGAPTPEAGPPAHAAADDPVDELSRPAPIATEWAAPPRRVVGPTHPGRPAARVRPSEPKLPATPLPRSPTHQQREYVVTRPERPHPHPGQPPPPGTLSEPALPALTIEVPPTDAEHLSSVPVPTVERPASEASAAPRSRAPGGARSWVAVAVFAVLGLLIVLGLPRDDQAAPDAATPADEAAEGVPPVTASADPLPGPKAPDGAVEPGPGAPGVTRLTLRSTPSHAEVTYQGTVLGETPIELEVPEGSHRFDLSKAGYRPVSVNVEGRGSQSLTHEIPLEPLPAPPPGATEARAETAPTPTPEALPRSEPSPAPPAP